MTEFAKAVVDTIGPKETWTPWPGGWPDEISTSLIDAIYSANAKYTTKHGKGILPLVEAWRAAPDSPVDSIPGLIKQIDDDGGPSAWKRRMNDQWAPSRAKDSPGGPTKAAAVSEAASNLQRVGITSSADLRDLASQAKQALADVSGVGYATTSYFFMLLGWPGVKPDRMIHAFIENATGRRLANQEAADLIRETAHELNVKTIALEHAIWDWQRNQ